MSVLKLILGFIVGAIACGILLGLVSLKTPILAGDEPAVLQKVDVATAENTEAEILENAEQKVNIDVDTESSVEPIKEEAQTEAVDKSETEMKTDTDDNAQTLNLDNADNPQVELDEPDSNQDKGRTIQEVEEQGMLNDEEQSTSLFKKAGNILTLGSGSSRLPSVDNANVSETSQEQAAQPVSAFASNANEQHTDKGALLSIIIVDQGAIGVTQAELLKQKLPYTFAVNGARSDAGFVTADYRDAGFEVVAMLNGEEAKNLQTAEQAAALVRATLNNVPDALAFVDDPAATLQKNRRLFGAVLSDVAKSGHGVLSYRGGLSSMAQSASDLDLPNGLINRYLDPSLTDTTGIARAIDRATVDALKDGAAIIMAAGTPELLAGINEWSNSNGAGKVTLVSLSSAIARLSR